MENSHRRNRCQIADRCRLESASHRPRRFARWTLVCGLFCAKGGKSFIEFWNLETKSPWPVHSHSASFNARFLDADICRGTFSPDSKSMVVNVPIDVVDCINLATGTTKWGNQPIASEKWLLSGCVSWLNEDGSRLTVWKSRIDKLGGMRLDVTILDAESGKVIRECSRPGRFRITAVHAPLSHLLGVESDPEPSAGEGESNLVLKWLTDLVSSIVDTKEAKDTRAQMIVLDGNLDPVFDYPLNFVTNSSISSDGTILAVTCRRGEQAWRSVLRATGPVPPRARAGRAHGNRPFPSWLQMGLAVVAAPQVLAQQTKALLGGDAYNVGNNF